MEIPFQSNSSAPTPNTTTAGSWGDFLNTVVRGTVQVIQSVKSPTGVPTQGGWAGTSIPLPGATDTHSSSSLLGLAIVIGLLLLVAKG